MPAAQHARREHRHDAGRAQGIGGEIGGERQRDPPHRLKLGVVEHGMDEFKQRGDDEANEHAAGRHEDELRDPRGNREPAGRNRRHGQREQHQGGGVIDDAFAFHERHDAARRMQFPHHGDRGGWIGGGQDGSQHHRGGERQRRDQPVGDDADRRHCRHHQADRQKQDRAQAFAKLRPRQMQGGLIENGRQQDGEDDFRRETDLRQSGNQRDRRSSEHQRHRIGQPQPARNQGERHAAHKQRDDDGYGQHRTNAPALRTGSKRWASL